jgi:hypothetical protein
VARCLGESLVRSESTLPRTDPGTLTHRPASFAASILPSFPPVALQYTALAFK